MALSIGGVYYSNGGQGSTQPQAETTNVQLVAGPGCYSWGCNGIDPTSTCPDGITVASTSLEDGLLELRYSPRCKSNWGRFTPWRKTAYFYANSVPAINMFARVTVWNSGDRSYGLAHAYKGVDNFGSSWSQMVDGMKRACTGVEIYTSSEGWRGNADNTEAPTDWTDKVWHWGPCR